MTHDGLERDAVEQIAEEFLERYRRGERPTITEYTARHPDLAPRIRALFPTLLLVEELGSSDAGAEGVSGEPPAVLAALAELQRLGDYRILRRIGRGGMGVVYEAEQESLGRHVALKVLPLLAVKDTNTIERFRREARATARLHHTNIVPVFEVGQECDVCYYAMQLIHGQPLDEVLRELKRLRAEAAPSTTDDTAKYEPGAPSAALVAFSLAAGRFEPTGPPSDAPALAAGPPEPSLVPTAEGKPSSADEVAAASSALLLGDSARPNSNRYFRSVARIGVQIAEALAYAHEHGIVHRDIKPSNLLLDCSGRIWVTDFGLAKADGDALTHTGDVVGTIRYMAPERFHGWSDPRSDVYSLGITLYEMLALRPAFGGSDRFELIRAVSNREPVRPRALDPRIPSDLETVVLKAIAKEPRDRYQTAGELAEDLRRFIDDKPVVARRAGAAEKLWRWCRRNPALASLGGVSIFLLAAIAAGATCISIRLSRQADALLERSAIAVVQQERAEQAEQEARAAERHATERLFQSLSIEARALRLSNQPGRRLRGLEAIAKAAELVPRIASGAAERRALRNEAIACLALADLQLEQRWDVGETALGAPALDGGGAHFAVCRRDGSLDIYRTADGKQRARLRLENLPSDPTFAPLWFSPDGRFLVASYNFTTGGRLVAWELLTDAVVLQDFAPAHKLAVEFADTSRLLVGRADGSLRVFDLETGKETARHTIGFPPHSLRLSPDRQFLAVSSVEAGTIGLFEWPSGKERFRRRHPSGVRGLAFDASSQLLAGGAADGQILLYEVPEGKLRRTFVGHQSAVTTVGFTPEQDRLVSSAWDGTTRLWNLASGAELLRITGTFVGTLASRRLAFASGSELATWRVAAAPEFVTADAKGGTLWEAAFHPEGRLIASTHDDGVRLWDASTWKLLAVLPVRHARSALFGERCLVTTGPGVWQWPIQLCPMTGDWKLGPPSAMIRHRQSERATPTADGRRLAVAHGDHIHVLDVPSCTEPLTIRSHPHAMSAAISPSGRWIASGTWQGWGMRLWDTQSGRLLRDLDPYARTALLQFSPDERYLVSGTGADYRVWNAGTWQLRFAIPRVGAGDLWGPIAISSDARIIAICPSRALQSPIRLIAALTGEELATLEAPVGQFPLCFSPDSRLLLVAGADQNLHVWNLSLVRERLAAMDLDWELPPLPAADDLPLKPIRCRVDLGELAPGSARSADPGARTAEVVALRSHR